MNLPFEQGINKPLTILNVVAIITLMLCILGFELVITVNFGSSDKSWIFVVSRISALLPLAYVAFWLLEWWQFEGSL